MASSYPRIAFQNLFNTSNISVTSEDTGYEIINLLDWKTYTTWKASSTDSQIITGDFSSNYTIDCLAFENHNLNGKTITIESSEDGGSNWTVRASFTIASDKAYAAYFTMFSANLIRITIPPGSEVVEIGVLIIGKSLEIPSLPDSGFDPTHRVATLDDAESETGRLLGRNVLYTKVKLSLNFPYLTQEWCNDYYIPFWEEHAHLPFFFTWNFSQDPANTYYVRFPSPELNLPFVNVYRSLYFDLEGLYE